MDVIGKKILGSFPPCYSQSPLLILNFFNLLDPYPLHRGKLSLPYYVQTEAGVLKKLSLAGLARLRRLRIRFGLATAGYRRLRVQDRPEYTAW